MKKKMADRSQVKNSSVIEDLNIKNDNQLPQLKLTSEKMAQLLSMIEIEREQNSPIPEFVKSMPVNLVFMNELIESKWVESIETEKTPELTPNAMNVLSALLAPNMNIQLILGSIKEMIFTELYSHSGFHDHTLVVYSYREDENLHVITPGQSPSEVSNTLLAHLMNGPNSEGMNFEFQLQEENLLVFLAVLDLIYSRQLEAKLRADNYPVQNFLDEDIWNRFTELRIGEDLLWCSVLIPFLFPYLQPQVTEESVKSTLALLVDEGLLTPMDNKVFQPTDLTLALAESIMPIINFASCAVINKENEGMHIAFVIGLNVNLVIQAFPDEDKNTFVLMGMDKLRLSRFLFEIGLPASSDENIKGE